MPCLAFSPNLKLAALVRGALAESRTTRAFAADHIGMKHRTFYRRLQDGEFTLAELHKIAEITDRRPADLIPKDAA